MPSDTQQTSTQLLAQRQLPASASRVAVLDILRQSPQRHLSAEQLCAAMLKQQDGLAISSFRRAIYDLAADGLLSRVVVPDGKNRTTTFYELADQAIHRHFYCTRCGSLTEIFDAELERAMLRRFHRQALQPANVDLALVGHCAHCRQALPDHATTAGNSLVGG